MGGARNGCSILLTFENNPLLISNQAAVPILLRPVSALCAVDASIVAGGLKGHAEATPGGYVAPASISSTSFLISAMDHDANISVTNISRASASATFDRHHNLCR
jgi:hypothetical protein